MNESGKKDLKAEMMERVCRSILEKDFDKVKEYFRILIDNRYDFMIIISRRCYILFQMFALMGGWKDVAVCTDLGIYAMRNRLKECRRVVVIDDIGYTGASMKRVLDRIKQYVPYGCKISAALYGLNKDSINQMQSIRVGPLKSVKVNCYCQLTERQCQELSVKLVSALLASGMPYTTFVFPVWGEKKADFCSNYAETELNTRKAVLNEYKWKTSYINMKELSWADRISDFQCLRIYRKEDSDYIYFLPFVFLKTIKPDKTEALYGCVADSFRELGKKDMAEEIETSMHEKREWQKDAMEYTASMISCLYSRMLADMLALDQFVNVWSEVAWDSLRGSFSETFVSLLKECDKEFWKSFSGKMMDKVKEEYFAAPGASEHEYIYYDRLKNYILGMEQDKEILDVMSDIFKWIRTESLKKDADQGKIWSISVDDLVSILTETGNYSKEEIYLAQIECWDRGIATYRFKYDERYGITANCGVGEMSSLLTALKYQNLIRKYYQKMLVYDGEVNGKVRNKILKKIIKEALENQEYTEREIDDFRKVVEERNGSLYGLLV